jgi:DNA-binding transcriptional ArsR family regulator
MTVDPDVPAVAALLAEPARVAMLLALQDGAARPAGELARLARVSPATGSAHLARLVQGGFLAAVRQGRHRYYRLARDDVAALFEALAGWARPLPPGASARVAEARALRRARTCYGHLAGWLGVAVADALCARGVLRRREIAFEVTTAGRRWLAEAQVAWTPPADDPAPLARACIDWSERRAHLAGPLGVALTRRFVDAGWLVRARDGRAVRVSERGRRAFREALGLEVDGGMR